MRETARTLLAHPIERPEHGFHPHRPGLKKTIMPMKLLHLSLLLGCLSLAGCTTPPPPSARSSSASSPETETAPAATNESRYPYVAVSKSNGAKFRLYFDLAKLGQTYEWEGPVNEAGFAHGRGTKSCAKSSGMPQWSITANYADGRETEGPFERIDYNGAGRPSWQELGHYDSAGHQHGKSVSTANLKWAEEDKPTAPVRYETTYLHGARHGEQIIQLADGTRKTVNYVNDRNVDLDREYQRQKDERREREIAEAAENRRRSDEEAEAGMRQRQREYASSNLARVLSGSGSSSSTDPMAMTARAIERSTGNSPQSRSTNSRSRSSTPPNQASTAHGRESTTVRDSRGIEHIYHVDWVGNPKPDTGEVNQAQARIRVQRDATNGVRETNRRYAEADRRNREAEAEKARREANRIEGPKSKGIISR